MRGEGRARAREEVDLLRELGLLRERVGREAQQPLELRLDLYKQDAEDRSL